MGSLGDETSRNKAMWFYPKLLGFHPSERWGHSACYSHGLVFVFGGCCGGLHFSDVLVLNLDTMSLSILATTGEGPGARDSHSAVLVGRQMFVFGGTNGSKKVNDLHVLDLTTKEWIRPVCKGTPPCPRESHTATLVGDDKIMIFGGSGEGEANYLNDLHVLDLKNMTWGFPEVKGDVPVPRDSHGAVAVGNELFVYGGDCGDRYHGDVDVLDTDTMTWTKLVAQGSSPGGRAGHAAVNIRNKIYVVGGVGDKHYYSDVWVLDVVTCSWNQLDICGQQPQGRFSHTAVVTGSDISIFGGCGEDERPLNELLVLQLRPDHPDSHYNIARCKIFGQQWNHGRTLSRRAENDLVMQNKQRTVLLANDEVVRKGSYEPELESKQAFQLTSDSPYSKKKRTTNSKSWEVELEQEEHSLSLSQHSSPSQSDQEQTPARKVSDFRTATRGLNLFNQLNQVPRNCQSNYHLQILREHKKPEQGVHVVHTSKQGMPVQTVEEKPKETGSVQNLIGADVRGRVDGAFDSGLLMTATVNGKIFRGVLFAPAPGIVTRGAVLAQNASPPAMQTMNVQQYQNWNQMDSLKPSQQPTTCSASKAGQSFRQMQMNSNRTYPLIRGAPSIGKEAKKQRNDLQGVVLTLGGSGNSHV